MPLLTRRSIPVHQQIVLLGFALISLLGDSLALRRWPGDTAERDLLHLLDDTFAENVFPLTLALTLTQALKHNKVLGLTKWRYFLRKCTDTRG